MRGRKWNRQEKKGWAVWLGLFKIGGRKWERSEVQLKRFSAEEENETNQKEEVEWYVRL